MVVVYLKGTGSLWFKSQQTALLYSLPDVLYIAHAHGHDCCYGHERQLLQRAITKHRVRDMIRMPGSFCDHKEDYILDLQPKMVCSQNWYGQFHAFFFNGNIANHMIVLFSFSWCDLSRMGLVPLSAGPTISCQSCLPVTKDWRDVVMLLSLGGTYGLERHLKLIAQVSVDTHYETIKYIFLNVLIEKECPNT